MPKQKLGTGNKHAVLQRPGTAYTSPRALRLQQRRARALDYRLQVRSYTAIGEAMKIHWLAPWAAEIPELAPPPQVWERIAEALPRAPGQRAGFWQSLVFWRSFGVVSALAAACL